MKYIFMLLFCLVLFLNNFAFAAENVAEPVIVTAGRITENVNTVPHSVTVIDEEALEKN